MYPHKQRIKATNNLKNPKKHAARKSSIKETEN